MGLPAAGGNGDFVMLANAFEPLKKKKPPPKIESYLFCSVLFWFPVSGFWFLGSGSRVVSCREGC